MISGSGTALSLAAAARDDRANEVEANRKQTQTSGPRRSSETLNEADSSLQSDQCLCLLV